MMKCLFFALFSQIANFSYNSYVNEEKISIIILHKKYTLAMPIKINPIITKVKDSFSSINIAKNIVIIKI